MTVFGQDAGQVLRGRVVHPIAWNAAVAAVPPAWPATLDGLPVEQALATFCAAARSGGAVVTGRPAGVALPELPEGGFLVAFTSGSTGSPRSIVRTLASWVDSFPAFTAATGITRDDRVLLTGPLSSTLQLFAAAHALWLGATVTDDPAVATVAHLVPTRLLEFAAAPPPLLRLAVVAGAQLPEVAVPFDLVEYYGAAELSLVAIRRPPEPFHPFPGVDLRLVDDCLQVRSPYLALGPTDDGWRGVGDRARLVDGTVVILGRGEDALSVGGHTVLCADVEDRLRTIDGIDDVVVLGLPHAQLGQIPVAAVVSRLSINQLRATARRLVDGPALPRRWQVVPELPLLPGGKVDRQRIAEGFDQSGSG